MLASKKNSWKDVPNKQAVKRKYRIQQMKKIIKNVDQKNAVNITKTIIQNCVKVTEKLRDFVADKADGKLPEVLAEGSAKYPGILGQASVIGFEVKTMDARETDSFSRGLHMHTAFKPMPKMRKSVQE